MRVVQVAPLGAVGDDRPMRVTALSSTYCSSLAAWMSAGTAGSVLSRHSLFRPAGAVQPRRQSFDPVYKQVGLERVAAAGGGHGPEHTDVVVTRSIPWHDHSRNDNSSR